jgi:hypothetical protein
MYHNHGGFAIKGTMRTYGGLARILKRVREQKILLPHYLYLNDRIHWADFHAGAALSACILIYGIFIFAFLNGVCGALLGARSARHTLVIDLIRHRSHLLTI